MADAFQREFFNVPVVTRSYVTGCAATSLLVQIGLLTPFKLYFHPYLIFYKHEYWRLFTTFLYHGSFGLRLMFNLLFTYRYCRMLEEHHFQGRTADFVYMFFLGGLMMVFGAFFVDIVFLGQAFTFMLVYIWSRKNPDVLMNFFGLLTLRAPYLTWVLLGFSLLIGNPIAVDVMGLVCGHSYYYLEDILPSKIGGRRILKTPNIIVRLVERLQGDDNQADAFPELPEDLVDQPAPGGYNWGQQPAQDAPNDAAAAEDPPQRRDDHPHAD